MAPSTAAACRVASAGPVRRSRPVTASRSDAWDLVGIDVVDAGELGEQQRVAAAALEQLGGTVRHRRARQPRRRPEAPSVERGVRLDARGRRVAERDDHQQRELAAPADVREPGPGHRVRTVGVVEQQRGARARGQRPYGVVEMREDPQAQGVRGGTRSRQPARGRPLVRVSRRPAVRPARRAPAAARARPPRPGLEARRPRARSRRAAHRSSSAVLPTPGSPLTTTTRAPARARLELARPARAARAARPTRSPDGPGRRRRPRPAPRAAAPRGAPGSPGPGRRRAPRRAAHASWRTRPAPTPVSRRPRARASGCAARPRRTGSARSAAVACAAASPTWPGGERGGGRDPAYLRHGGVRCRAGVGRPLRVGLVGQQRAPHQRERALGGGAGTDECRRRRPGGTASRVRVASSSTSHQSAISA